MHVRDETGEVFAPVAMWMEALDLVLDRLRDAMPVSMSRICGVSGSGQQHGSVFWNNEAEGLLSGLDPKKSLVSQLKGALAHEWSPNWQDQSTQKECDAFDALLGGRESLAEVTGSGAHHVSTPFAFLEVSVEFRIRLVVLFLRGTGFGSSIKADLRIGTLTMQPNSASQARKSCG